MKNKNKRNKELLCTVNYDIQLEEMQRLHMSTQVNKMKSGRLAFPD
jgi:hypothetical protein